MPHCRMSNKEHIQNYKEADRASAEGLALGNISAYDMKHIADALENEM